MTKCRRQEKTTRLLTVKQTNSEQKQNVSYYVSKTESRQPVITKCSKILAKRINSNSLNKTFVLRKHPQLMTCSINSLTVNDSLQPNSEYSRSVANGGGDHY